MFGSHEKITKRENATVVGIWQRPVAVAGFRRACLAGSGQIWLDSGQILPESGLPASGHGGRMSPEVLWWPDSGTGIILIAGCCRISVPPGFRRPIIV